MPLDVPIPGDAACVDLRPPAAHAALRPAGAVRLEVQDLLLRPYLLPPRARALVLVGGGAALLAPVVRALHAAGHAQVVHLPEESWQEHLPPENGPPTRTHLWEPSPALVRALAAHGAMLAGRRAFDLACGSGRNAVYLALQGFEVTAIDRLPDALEKAADLARRSGVALHTLELDLEPPGALAGLGADLVVVVRYLERALFATLERVVVPGGLLVYETFTEAQAALGHPRNPRFLLRAGELRRGFPDLETLEYEEGFLDGAHVARLVARRPSAPARGEGRASARISDAGDRK